jgi:AraC-like DNA-binding protein
MPESGVHLYESKHSKGHIIPEHYHDHFQILYALEGEGELSLDKETYEFSKDQVVLIVPQSIHSIKARSKLTVLVLVFSKILGQDIESLLLEVFKLQSTHFQLDVVRASEVRQLLRKMLFEQTNYDPLCKYSSPIYLFELLLILARNNKNKPVLHANDKRSNQMRKYIEANYFENITAESLSTTFNISPRYMNDIFKEKYHETPLQYLQKVRIDRAKILLSDTEKDIVSICFEVGYETLSTFYRSFRNLVGMSPNKYRKLHQVNQR